MNACEYFTSINSKLHKNNVKTTIPAMVISFVQTFALSLVISCFNVNTLFSSTNFLFAFRTFLIFLSFSTETINKILIKNKTLSPTHSFIYRFLSIFLFSNSFIFSPITFKLYFKGSFILFYKLFFHSNIIFSIVNSLLLAFYLTFYSYLISFAFSYTQIIGFIFYLKTKISSIFSDSIKISILTGKWAFIFMIGYLTFIHTIIKTVLVIIRISPYYNSIWDLTIFIFVVTITNTIYYIGFRLIDSFILFNSSFICDDSRDGSLEFEFHKIAIAYKSKEIKLKNNSKAIKIIEKYIEEEISNIKHLLNYIEISKKHFDSSHFIYVPQPNKSCTKKYKVFHIHDVLKSRIAFNIEKWLFTERFNVLIDHFFEILKLCKNIKESENIVILHTKNQIEALEMLRISKTLASQLNLKIELDNIAEIINKLV